jgi:predicted phage terminase large subunit-like protein
VLRNQPSSTEYRSREDRAKQRLYQLSLLRFGQACYEMVENQTYIHGKHAELLTRHLEAVARKDDPVGRISELVINMPPSTSKSFWVNIAFPSWIYTWWPQCQIQTFGYNDKLVKRDHDKCRQIIGSQWYQRLFPGIEVMPGHDQANYFKLKQGGIRLCLVPGSGFSTGNHPDIIIAEDPMSVEQARSFAERQAQSYWWFETMGSRGVAKDSARVVSQQRVDLEDLSGAVLQYGKELEISGQKNPVVHLMLPMWFDPENQMKNVGYGGDWRTKPGELVFPEVLNEERTAKLTAKISAKGPWAVDSQLKQAPKRRDGSMFKLSKVIDTLPFADFPTKFDRIIRYWDLAASDEGMGCFSAGILVGFIGKPETTGLKAYILDVQHVQKEPEELDDLIELTCKLDWLNWRSEDDEGRQVLESYFEKGTSDTGKRVMAILERRFLPWNMKAARPQKDKITRAEPLGTLIATGCFYVPADAPWKAKYLAEFEPFPGGRFKDQVDGTSGAVMEYLNPSIKRSTGMALPTASKAGELVKFKAGSLGECKNPHCKVIVGHDKDRKPIYKGRPAFGVGEAEGYCCQCCKEASEWGESCERHDPHCVLAFSDWYNKHSKD